VSDVEAPATEFYNYIAQGGTKGEPLTWESVKARGDKLAQVFIDNTLEDDSWRDRKSEYEPQILKKNRSGVTQDIEEKILSMYAKGMTTGDIEAHIRDIYGIEVSDTTVSRITDKILPIAGEWQQRPLEAV
jgi:transposase-like protein